MLNASQPSIPDTSSGSCCGGRCDAHADPGQLVTREPSSVRINGRWLPAHTDGDGPTLQERAWTELLRQQAVQLGRIVDTPGDEAPEPDAAMRHQIEALLDAAVQTPLPTTEACERYYAAHQLRFRHGQRAQLRHILFAVTPGVPVQALAQRAEAMLLSLCGPDAAPEAFAQTARDWSNCPSAAQGGALGWVGPMDCAPELAQFLFFQREGGPSIGVQPRLVHSRYGLHIVDVQAYEPGTLASFEQVQACIAGTLALQSRATALRQYLQLLVGQADIEGLALEGADTPLVQ
ncbi:peptidylprolyl isomerase [Acidovorax lacteus]|uniref:peptidylprolyl isomerase n=1 Tax=Acidovorax lacteus TaxID=1924988 RepID=A0ABP8L4D3_9BURK